MIYIFKNRRKGKVHTVVNGYSKLDQKLHSSCGVQGRERDYVTELICLFYPLWKMGQTGQKAKGWFLLTENYQKSIISIVTACFLQGINWNLVPDILLEIKAGQNF